MVSKNVLKIMKSFVDEYDGLEIKGDDEATFDLESDIVWFDCYQYNIENEYDCYTNKLVLSKINYWKKYLKNKELVKSSFWNQGKKEVM